MRSLRYDGTFSSLVSPHHTLLWTAVIYPASPGRHNPSQQYHTGFLPLVICDHHQPLLRSRELSSDPTTLINQQCPLEQTAICPPLAPPCLQDRNPWTFPLKLAAVLVSIHANLRATRLHTSGCPLCHDSTLPTLLHHRVPATPPRLLLVQTAPSRPYLLEQT